MAKRKLRQLTLDGKKQTPKMPEGYYSDDKPNPNLRAFVEQHIKENPYDPTIDRYKVNAFDKPIKTTKANNIYNIHPYWAKKPHTAIVEYIRHYTKEGDLVFDPFCGSGTTALAALLENRKALAIDLSPAATFISKIYCSLIPPEKFQREYERVVSHILPITDWLYETRCDRCGGKAIISHTVLSQEFQCKRCLNFIPIFLCKSEKVGKKNLKICPICHKNEKIEEISARKNKRGSLVPVEIIYDCFNNCRPRRASRYLFNNDLEQRWIDFDKLRNKEIAEAKIPFWFPKNELPNPTLSHRLYKQGITRIDQLFTKRNLWALAALRQAIYDKSNEEYIETDLLGAFTAILIKSSHLMGHGSDGVGRVFSGAFFPQSIRQEANIMKYFNISTRNIQRGMNDIFDRLPNKWDLIISNQAAQELSQISDNSIDYIFTDPPYSDKVPFWELNLIWEAWLGLSSDWEEKELIVNERRNKNRLEYENIFSQSFKEIYRVLKPGRWVSLVYHDTSEGTWHLVQDIMAEIGFIFDPVEKSLYIDATTPTIHHIKDSKIVKRDLVINFCKPKPGQLKLSFSFSGKEDKKTFREKVISVIRKYLTTNPGSTKDKIYDSVVSRMVRKKQLESFNFDSLLSEVAEYVVQPKMKDLFTAEDPDLFSTHEIRRWYLKETAEIVDEAESLLEDKAAKKLETFMKKFLEEHTEYEGVHYSDLFQQYLPIVKKPKRQMADWLIDYFYKTPEGTWRPPETDEEVEEKQKQRQTGSLRRIKTYARLLETGIPIPDRLVPDSDHTIVDWIRQARRSGLYQQGKIIFEKSGLNLSTLEETDEDLAMDVNEDYRICLKRLGQKKK